MSNGINSFIGGISARGFGNAGLVDGIVANASEQFITSNPSDKRPLSEWSGRQNEIDTAARPGLLFDFERLLHELPEPHLFQ